MNEPKPRNSTQQVIFGIFDEAFPSSEFIAKKWQKSEWSDQYRFILKSRMKGTTLEKIGYELGYTKERVRQKEAKALRIFRNKVERGFPRKQITTEQKSRFIENLRNRMGKK